MPFSTLRVLAGGIVAQMTQERSQRVDFAVYVADDINRPGEQGLDQIRHVRSRKLVRQD